MYKVRLKVPTEQYENRRDRLKKLIDLNAPDGIICAEARLVTECFHHGIRERFNRWQMRKCPTWLWWICSAEYRQICRDQDTHDLEEFEAEMRKMLSCKSINGKGLN